MEKQQIFMILYAFTQPLRHEQDVTQGQFSRGVFIQPLRHEQDVTQG